MAEESLSLRILNPFDGLDVIDFAKIALGCREVRMPQNHLARNLNGNTGA